MKVIIVGAGIAGLAIGWRLARANVRVEIFERGMAGRSATWAAAGMIIPGGELEHGSAELAQFARRSRQAWPEFAAELESESGGTIDYSEPGSLFVAFDEEAARALEQRAARIASSSKAEWVAPKELRKREPLLSTALHGALHIPEDARVDNRLVAEALRLALSRRKAALHENTDVSGLTISDGRVRGIVCNESTIEADAVIVATGAWMNDLNGTAGALPPMNPVKGQMVCVRPPQDTALPRALLGSDDVYLVPRGDRILIGATVEDAGFDTSISQNACSGLLSAAARIIPDVNAWPVSEMWAGLRPRTPDHAPVLGQTALSGLFVASGQYRNGILFAPAIADAISRIVLTGEVSSDVRAFDPRRFPSS